MHWQTRRWYKPEQFYAQDEGRRRDAQADDRHRGGQGRRCRQHGLPVSERTLRQQVRAGAALRRHRDAWLLQIMDRQKPQSRPARQHRRGRRLESRSVVRSAADRHRGGARRPLDRADAVQPGAARQIRSGASSCSGFVSGASTADSRQAAATRTGAGAGLPRCAAAGGDHCSGRDPQARARGSLRQHRGRDDGGESSRRSRSHAHRVRRRPGTFRGFATSAARLARRPPGAWHHAARQLGIFLRQLGCERRRRVCRAVPRGAAGGHRAGPGERCAGVRLHARRPSAWRAHAGRSVDRGIRRPAAGIAVLSGADDGAAADAGDGSHGLPHALRTRQRRRRRRARRISHGARRPRKYRSGSANLTPPRPASRSRRRSRLSAHRPLTLVNDVWYKPSSGTGSTFRHAKCLNVWGSDPEAGTYLFRGWVELGFDIDAREMIHVFRRKAPRGRGIGRSGSGLLGRPDIRSGADDERIRGRFCTGRPGTGAAGRGGDVDEPHARKHREHDDGRPGSIRLLDRASGHLHAVSQPAGFQDAGADQPCRGRERQAISRNPHDGSRPDDGRSHGHEPCYGAAVDDRRALLHTRQRGVEEHRQR